MQYFTGLNKNMILSALVPLTTTFRGIILQEEMLMSKVRVTEGMKVTSN